MRAVVIEGINKVALREVKEPTLTPDRILVKIKAATICNSTDLYIIKGLVPPEPPQRRSPSILGHEGAGEVVAVGEKVSGFKPGDRVALCPWEQGTFTEYIAVKPEEVIMKVPENLTYEEASCLELLVNVVKATFPNICWGDKVIILGQGPAGLLMTQCAKLLGALVMVTEINENRRRLSKKLGADVVIDPSQADVTKELLKFAPHGADVVIECAGVPATIAIAPSLAKEDGTIRLFGSLLQNKKVTFDFSQLHPSKTILGPCASHGRKQFTWCEKKVYQTVSQLILSQKINIKSLITHRLPLTEYHRGLELVENKEAIKVALLP